MQNIPNLFVGLFLVFSSYGQVPNSMSFQAVVRNNDGELISNQQIQVKLSILKGSNSGPILYSELHSPTTNFLGLFSLTIGQGIPITGLFQDIDWSGGDLYLKREIDPNNNGLYPITGTTQFLTIPYSFYSNVADSSRIARFSMVADSVIKKQQLSISNDTIYLSGGGFAKLPSITPPILSVSASGDTLYIGGGNYIIVPGISLANHPLTDIDGNVYDTVHIGTQIWMKSNLKTTKYNDGTDIPNVTDEGTWWSAFNTGARSYYNNDSISYAMIYGALYNWAAVNTGILCPCGWHVPSDIEWTTLTDYLGGDSVSGGKLKSTSYWNSPNTGASDEFGFNALPGGLRLTDVGFMGILSDGIFWTSTSTGGPPFPPPAWRRSFRDDEIFVERGWSLRSDGFSVRCLKD